MGAIWTLGGDFGTTFGVTFWKVACPGSVRDVATCLLLKKHIVGTSKAGQRRLSAHRRSISLEKKYWERVEDNSTDIPATGTHFPRKTSWWCRLTRGRRQRPQAFSVRRPQGPASGEDKETVFRKDLSEETLKRRSC